MDIKKYFKRRRELKELEKAIDKKIEKDGINYMFSREYNWRENKMQDKKQKRPSKKNSKKENKKFPYKENKGSK